MRKRTDSFLAFILTFVMVFNMLGQVASPPVYAGDPPALEQNSIEEDSGLLSLEVPPESEEVIATEPAIQEPAIISPVTMESSSALSEDQAVQLLSEDSIVNASDFPPPPGPPPAINYPITAPGSITVDADPPAVFSFPAASTHYFTFTVATPGNYTAAYQVVMPGPVLTVKFGTVSGTTFNQITPDAVTTGAMTYNFTEAGTFYLEVANSAAAGMVMLAVTAGGGGTPPPPTPIDYTISSPGAMTIGMPFNVMSFPEGSTETPSNQYFTFTVSTPGAYTMGYMASGPAITLVFGTLSGETFTPITPDATTTAGIIYNFDVPGTFLLKASNTGAAGSVGLLVSSGGGTPPEEPEFPPYTLGTTASAILTAVNQEELYTFTVPSDGYYLARIINYDTDGHYYFSNSDARICLGSYADGTFTPFTPVDEWEGQADIMENLEADQEVVIQVSYSYNPSGIALLEPIFMVDEVTPPAPPSVDVPFGEVSVSDFTEISVGESTYDKLVTSVTAEAGMEIYIVDPMWGDELLGTASATISFPDTTRSFVSGDFFSIDIYAKNPATEAKSEITKIYYYYPVGPLSFVGNTATASGTMTSGNSLLYTFTATADESYGVKATFTGDTTMQGHIIDIATGETWNLDQYGYAPYIGDNTRGWQDTGFTAVAGGTYLLYVENNAYAGTFSLTLEKGVPSVPEMSTTATQIGTGWMAHYEELVPVTLTTDTVGASIFYNLYYFGDDAPDEPVYVEYTGSFNLGKSADLRAYTFKDGAYSQLYFKSFHIANPDAPVLTPSESVQIEGTTITITSQPETTVYYTIDGIDPTSSTPTYFTVGTTGNITGGTNTVTLPGSGLDLKAVAYKNGLASEISHIQYTVGIPKPLWTNKSVADTYSPGYQPTLSGSGLGTIYYTLDGTNPASSPMRQIYTTAGNITVQQNTRLRAVEQSAEETSPELSAFIEIDAERSLTLGEEAQSLVYSNYTEQLTLLIPSAGDYTIHASGDSFSGIYMYGPGLSGYYYPADFPLNFTATDYNIDTNSGYLDMTVYAVSDNTNDARVNILIERNLPAVSFHGIPKESGWGVTLNALEEGASIYYTTDNSDPTVASTLYAGEEILTATNGTIKAIAVTGSGESQVISSILANSFPMAGMNFDRILYKTDSEASYNAYVYLDPEEIYQEAQYYLVPYSYYSQDYNVTEAEFYLDYGTDTDSLGTSNTIQNYPYYSSVSWDTSISPFSGAAVVRAKAFDNRGNSQMFIKPITLQTAPVSAPTGLTSGAITTGAIKLQWTAPGDLPSTGTVYYDVFRGTSADTSAMEKVGTAFYTIGEGSPNPTADFPFTTYIPNNANDTFYYAVRAYVAAGRFGPFSNVIQTNVIGFKDTQAPVINGIEDYSSNVLLAADGYISEDSWYMVDLTENVALNTMNAEIRPYDVADGWQSIANVDETDAYFILSSDLPDTLADGRYVIRVNATDKAGNASSFTISLWMDNTAPTVPVISNVEPIIGKIRLTFQSTSDDVHHYQVAASHSETRYDIPAPVSGGAVVYDFVPNNLTNTYDFQVSAFDRAGNRADSVTTAVGYQALAYRPTMSILPDVSKPGQILEITVSGMMPGESVSIYLDESGSAFDWENADGTGTVVFPYAIPSNMTGAHRFKAVGYSSAARVIKTYVIGQYMPVVEVPAQANAGDTITVQVRDFGLVNAGSTGYVQIYLNGTEVSSIAVENNTTGAAVLAGSRSYLIPYTASGTMEIRAVRDTYTAISTMNVVARSAALTVAPAGRSAGQTVTASVSGFAPGEGVEFSKNGAYVSYRYADQTGAVQLDIALGAADKGTVLFEAKGNTSGLRRSFLYESSATLWSLTGPVSVYAGTSPNFTLAGLEQTEAVNFYVNGVYYAQVWGYAGGLAERTIYISEPGRMQITAVGQTTGRTASMICTAENPEGLDPSLVTLAVSYAAGSVVTLNASGFAPYETVVFYWNNTQIASLAANVSGTASAQYTIPAETPAEAGYAFSAYGNSSQLLASYAPAGAAHDLGLALSGSPKPGQTLDAEITGPYTADPCKIYLDGKDITTLVSMSTNGEGNTVFTYPLLFTIAVGSHNLLVMTNSGALGEVALTVADPGTSVQVNPTTHAISLAGFHPGEAIQLKVNGGTALEGITADGSGAFVYTPASLYGAGQYQVTALGEDSSFFAQTSFTVQAAASTLVAAPENLLPGGRATLSMAGYGAAEILRIYLGDEFIKDTVAPTDGSGAATDTLSFKVRLPRNKPGRLPPPFPSKWKAAKKLRLNK